jgi:sugar phosphate isomerase/epimerase
VRAQCGHDEQPRTDPQPAALQKQIDLATAIGAKGIIVHGGHVGNEDDLGVGFDNWRKCIDGLTITLPLLIENTAGGNGAMARQLERIDQLWSTIASASGARKLGGFRSLAPEGEPNTQGQVASIRAKACFSAASVGSP